MAYAFNEDRSKVDVYTEDEIDAMNLANNQDLQDEIANRIAAVTAESDARQQADSDEATARSAADTLVNARIDTLVDHGTGGIEVRQELWTSVSGVVNGSINLSDDPDNYDCLELVVGDSPIRKIARIQVTGGVVDISTGVGPNDVKVSSVQITRNGDNLSVSAADELEYTGSWSYSASGTAIPKIYAVYGIKYAQDCSAEVADIRVGYDGTTYASAGDAVRADEKRIEVIEKQNGLYNLIGPKANVYYRVPKISVGDVMTVSTSDGSTFTGKHLFFYDEDFVLVGDIGLTASYGSSRTFTISTAAVENAKYVLSTELVPLMLNFGNAAPYVEYMPSLQEAYNADINPMALNLDCIKRTIGEWHGVAHAVNAGHSSLLDLIPVDLRPGDEVVLFATIDGIKTGSMMPYLYDEEGNGTSKSWFNLDTDYSFTIASNSNPIVAIGFYFTSARIPYTSDVNVSIKLKNNLESSVNNLKRGTLANKSIVYITSNSGVDVESISSGKTVVTFNSGLVFRIGGNSIDINGGGGWANYVTALSSSDYSIDGNKCTFTLSYSRQLVFNIDDSLLHIRQYGSTYASDIILAATQYGRLCGGFAWEQLQDKRITKLESDVVNLDSNTVKPSDLLTQSFNASYHLGAVNFSEKCTEFSSLMYGDTIAGVTAPSDCESFLFFTDPHLCQTSGWENRCYEFISQIQKYYNSTPTSFCVCGGDWLGNSDLPDTACFKLGYIDGFMHSMFDNCYMLVGNHDTNYQGKLTPESATYTTRLSDQSIRNLWYRGSKAYYDFMGSNTRFFCFDTGTENQALSAFDNYGYEQAEWFASNLMTNTSEHVAILAHILYPLTIGTLQPLTTLVLQISEAFNNRSNITVNGTNYNFAGKTGKVEFGLFGHYHADGEYVHNSIPCIMTTNVRAGGDVVGPTFDLVFVNYDDDKINLIRVGSGSNRTVSIA